jgi:hypothetical protein
VNWIKRLFCTHAFEFVRNLYGDQIIEWNWKRSVWRCSKCGKLEGRDTLHNVDKGAPT